jgi:FIMAH domain-containing protein
VQEILKTWIRRAADNVNNAGTNSVTFSVIVTAESIKVDVRQFVAAGKITVDTGNSLHGLLDAAAQARTAGNCATANKIYHAFITEVAALSGKKIDPTAAQIMIVDAQYLIMHCP